MWIRSAGRVPGSLRVMWKLVPTRLTRRAAWILVASISIAIAAAPSPASQVVPTSRTVLVTASSFAYEPAVIRVSPGDRVTLEFASADVVHGLRIDGYPVDLTAEPGKTAGVTFLADREGRFVIRCSVTCGPLHPFMVGRLEVGSNWLLLRSLALAVLAISLIAFMVP